MDETRLARPGHAMQEITAAVRNTTFSIPLFIQSLFSRADSQVLENSREKKKKKKGGGKTYVFLSQKVLPIPNDPVLPPRFQHHGTHRAFSSRPVPAPLPILFP